MSSHTFGRSQFVTLDDGRRLHFRISGRGTPTVVFESGLGLSGAIWGLVQPAIAQRTSTVVYDRAGSGASDDDTEPRTLDRIVGDLAQLLRHLSGPFVLVGASWGGPIIRALSATGEFPIRGLVLVDQSDENGTEIFTPADERRMVQTARLTMLLARTGLYRLFARVGRAQPGDVYADLCHDFTVRGARMMAAEVINVRPALQQLRENPHRLDGIEVAIITGTRAGLLERKTRSAINRAHATTAASSRSARLVEAHRSGHFVMFSEPKIIVAEILSMLDPSDSW